MMRKLSLILASAALPTVFGCLAAQSSPIPGAPGTEYATPRTTVVTPAPRTRTIVERPTVLRQTVIERPVVVRRTTVVHRYYDRRHLLHVGVPHLLHVSVL